MAPLSLPSPPTVRRHAPWLLVLGALVACGQIASPPVDGDGDEQPPIGRPGRDAGRSDGGRDGGRGRPDPNTPDARNDYVDPECGDIPPPIEMYDCDPIAQIGCMEDESCSPFVDYPSDPCSSEVYGAMCIPAGTLTQGESCSSQMDCAAGYICLITGAGTTCGRACDLEDQDACSDGLICVSTDVTGIGACY